MCIYSVIKLYEKSNGRANFFLSSHIPVRLLLELGKRQTTRSQLNYQMQLDAGNRDYSDKKTSKASNVKRRYESSGPIDSVVVFLMIISSEPF